VFGLDADPISLGHVASLAIGLNLSEAFLLRADKVIE
jgi:hypothetical protein